MKRFPSAHAAHPQWEMAVGLVAAQLRAQLVLPDYAQMPTLGMVYITDYYATHAGRILERLIKELPDISDWVGATGIGVCATDAEYIDYPALSVMLCDLPRDRYRVYSGVAPLSPEARFRADTALVHADGAMPDLTGLIDELSRRVGWGYLFGGITLSRIGSATQFAWSRWANQPPPGGDNSGAGAPGGPESLSGVFSGGLSGVAFASGITLVSRVTHGCRPIGPERLVTAADGHVILTLDNHAALDVLLSDLMLDPGRPREALPVLHQTLAGLSFPGEHGVLPTGDFGSTVRVRQLIGIDPAHRAVTIGESMPLGQRLAFCKPNPQAARTDLVRICAEIREALEPQEELAVSIMDADSEVASNVFSPRILGAHYASCMKRSGVYFGAPGAELRIIRQVLGDVPLTGFFVSGEIAYHHLHRYAGVLTVFAEGLSVRPRDDSASGT